VESAGGQLVLVDGVMRVRGFYDASDPASVDALLQAAGAVAGAARP
jgi:hypothetical protein